MESFAFMLKPIVDKFYEEAKICKERIETLEKRNKELEEKLAKQEPQGKKKKPEVYVIGDDDDVYADEALAPESLAPVKEEKTITVVENTTSKQEDNKQVIVNTDKDRKEYMKEYQRNYRKKQKEKALKQ
jgi:hypothetical protein